MKTSKIKTLNTTYKAGVTVTLEQFGTKKFHYYAEYANGKTTSSKIFSSKKEAFESYETFCQGITFAPVEGLVHLGNGFYVTA